MEGFHCRGLRLPRCPRFRGQEGRPVLTALGAPDNDAVLAELHVLEAQADALQQAQAAAISALRHEGVPARHGDEQPRDLRLGEPGGQPLLACAADRGELALKGLGQDIPAEKTQRSGPAGVEADTWPAVAGGSERAPPPLPLACSDGSCRRREGECAVSLAIGLSGR